MMDDPAPLAKPQSPSQPQLRQDAYIRSFARRFLAMESTGALIMDNDFRIVEISGMICDMLGCERTETLGQPVMEWFAVCGLSSAPFDRSLLEGETFRDRPLSLAQDNGALELMLDGELLRSEDDGEITGAFVLFKDVTHQFRLEEQIRQSDRLKTIGEIAAGTAHEIRNPLTAMKGFMQLLNKTMGGRGMVKEQEYIGIVLSELERVNGLVSEFLLLGKPKITRQLPLRVGHVLQELLPMIRNEALLHNVTVHCGAGAGTPAVTADKELLKQVFLNLGKNAIEAMRDGGKLVIRIRSYASRKRMLAVEVCDTGTGIPAAALDRVFDPFFTTKSEGTGLGLSVCQRIVHDLGGSIEVVSGATGTKFTVWLPCAAEEAELPIVSDGGAGLGYHV